MKIPIFMIFQFFGIISSWSVKALEDGKVTAEEGLELVISLASILGVKPEFDISDYVPKIDLVIGDQSEKVLNSDLKTQPDFKEPEQKP